MPTVTRHPISASVGYGGKNNKRDVLCVQGLLNKFAMIPLKPVEVSGIMSESTLIAINEFQTRHFGMQTPDGRIDAGGRTIQALMAEPSSRAPTTIQISGKTLPAIPLKVLTEISHAANLKSVHVSSVERSPADQARIMHDNIFKLGLKSQYKLYAATGDKIIKVYEINSNKSKDEVIALMAQKIREVGPEKVSKHISEDFYVFDVPWSSIANRKAFEKAVKVHPSVSKYLNEPANKCFHIEIKKT